jgi:hypothetical protein
VHCSPQSGAIYGEQPNKSSSRIRQPSAANDGITVGSLDIPQRG